jgi:hypothetical protein
VFKSLPDCPGTSRLTSFDSSRMASILDSLTSKWRVTSGSPYFDGLTIHKSDAYECKSGSVTDGLVRVLSEEEDKINLKRKVEDANDHIFTVKH